MEGLIEEETWLASGQRCCNVEISYGIFNFPRSYFEIELTIYYKRSRGSGPSVLLMSFQSLLRSIMGSFITAQLREEYAKHSDQFLRRKLKLCFVTCASYPSSNPYFFFFFNSLIVRTLKFALKKIKF